HVYNKAGHRTGKTIKKGTSITTHGKKKTINGKKYYKIAKNQYIRSANLY
ncbi:MAG: SLAP domain-containing protein, partial [Lactobacillus crispatus]|nr:SLAP domain-containing protein [Lactobacillus crispatus]